MVIVLKAPNGQVFNLDANINKTGGPGANFINTVISSASTTPLSAGAPPIPVHSADAVGATYVAVDLRSRRTYFTCGLYTNSNQFQWPVFST
ncbi:MAG: hypothetical protein IPL50_19415 [Chitinophagaceae bacterium]|nr:hypothetical protein [Chitinophagaceae bacterium]